HYEGNETCHPAANIAQACCNIGLHAHRRRSKRALGPRWRRSIWSLLITTLWRLISRLLITTLWRLISTVLLTALLLSIAALLSVSRLLACLRAAVRIGWLGL